MLERDKSNIDFQLTFIHKRVTKLTERFMFRLKNFGVEYSPKIIILRHFVEQTKAIEIDNILFIQTCVVINTRFETQRYSLGITDVDVWCEFLHMSTNAPVKQFELLYNISMQNNDDDDMGLFPL